MTTFSKFLSLMTLTLIGCGESETTTSTSTSTSTTSQTSTTTLTYTTDGVSPYVEEGTIYCFNTGGSSKVDTWLAEVTANDPQGIANVASFGSYLGAFTIQGDQEVYWDMLLVCADGSCSGTLTETITGISCDNAGNYYFAVQMVDNEDNYSEITELEKTDG